MKFAITATLIICSLFAHATGDDSTSAKQALPDVTIKNIDNENVNMSTYGTNGKITIISFWATWCKPCIKELKNVNALLEEWEEDYNVELVAVSVDDARNQSKVRPFSKGMGWDFDILLDPNGDLQRAMNVTNPPVSFLVDQNGKIVYTHTGYLEGDEYDLEDEIKKLQK
jgi:cytochrome c biogenesis protein CcmG, thiol:disulfide interchange protein DsbE